MTQYNCTLNEGLCGWIPGGEIEWHISHTTTPSQFTGPRNSLTEPTNRYLFIEATEADEGQEAHLWTGELKNAACLFFDYHAHGADMGTLKVQVRTATGQETVWSTEGDQGQFWQTKYVTINPGVPYKVALVAVRGASFRSDLGLDNLGFTSGVCPTASKCSFSDDSCQLIQQKGERLQLGCPCFQINLDVVNFLCFIIIGEKSKMVVMSFEPIPSKPNILLKNT